MSTRELAFEVYVAALGLSEADRDEAQADFNAGWEAREAVQS